MPVEKPRFKKVKIAVKFGGVSLSADTASVGVTVMVDDFVGSEPSGDRVVDRAKAVARIDELLCVRQLKGRITIGRRDEGETQGKLYETDDFIEATFLTNRVSLGSKNGSAKLSMPAEEVDARVLQKFSGRDGWFTITSLMEQLDLDDETPGDPDENDAKRPMLDVKEGKKAKAK